MQAKQVGYRIIYCPEAEVIDECGASTGKLSYFTVGALLVSSLYYWKNMKMQMAFN